MSVPGLRIDAGARMLQICLSLAVTVGLSALSAFGQTPEMPGTEPTLLRVPAPDGQDHVEPFHTSRPDYTPEARAAGIEGTVLLSVTVDRDGHPKSVRVLRSLDPGLDQNAVQSVSSWRFRPKNINDGSRLEPIVVEIRFQLAPDTTFDSDAPLHEGVSTPPKLLYKAEPEYDQEARDAKIQGTVLLRATIGTDGRPSNIRVARRLIPSLDQKALECAAMWRFHPAFRAGVARSADVTIEVHFRL